MTALSQTVDLGAGRQAAYEVFGEGAPLLYFEGGAGFSAPLLRRKRSSAAIRASHGIQRLVIPGMSGPTAVKAWESGIWQTIDARPLPAKIECPTPVLVGGLDLICGPAPGRLIAEAVPSAELVIVPDSGHFIAAEAPKSFRDVIIKFAG